MEATTGSSNSALSSLPSSDVAHSDMHTSDAFRKLTAQGSVTGYAHVAIDFVMFIIAAATACLQPNITGIIPEEQKRRALTYVHAITRATGREGACLHELLFSIFTHKMCDDGVDLPSYRFLALYSIRKDGNLDAANNITGVISKLVYLGRAAIYNSVTARVNPLENIGFFE